MCSACAGNSETRASGHQLVEQREKLSEEDGGERKEKLKTNWEWKRGKNART